MKKIDNTKCWQKCGQLDLSYADDMRASLYNYFENLFDLLIGHINICIYIHSTTGISSAQILVEITSFSSVFLR